MYNENMKVKWSIPNLNVDNLKKIWCKKSVGFGDTFAKITKTLGFTPCASCEERQKKWNEALAYKKSLRKKKD